MVKTATPKVEQYLKGFWPTPMEQRLSFYENIALCYQAGFDPEREYDDDNELIVACAVAAAECGNDEDAYLAYLDITYDPSNPNDLANKKATLKGIGTSMFLNGAGGFKEWLAGRNWVELTDYDRGFCQASTRWQPNVTDQEAFEGVAASKVFFRIFKGRGRRFDGAWAAYDGGHHKKYLPYARQAYGELLRRIKNKTYEPISDDNGYLPTITLGNPANTWVFARKFGRRWFREDWESFRDALRRHGGSWRLWSMRNPKRAKRIFDRI